MSHPAQLPIDQLLKECRIHPTRRSGPGGQHRNKVQTAVVIEHLPSGVHGEASERRSQAENRREAIQRLRVNLALARRHSAAAYPPAIWKKRVRAGRIAVNPQHEDFPLLLAVALDTIWAHQFVIPSAAEQLGVSTSQLVKLLRLEKAALVAVNRAREALGEGPLR